MRPIISSAQYTGAIMFTSTTSLNFSTG